MLTLTIIIDLCKNWVSDCCLTPTQQFFSYIMEQVNFQWNDDEVHFVLDQHAELDFYSASWLKQQSADRKVSLLWRIIRANPSLFFLLNEHANYYTIPMQF
jgi:hypothetical protein